MKCCSFFYTLYYIIMQHPCELNSSMPYHELLPHHQCGYSVQAGVAWVYRFRRGEGLHAQVVEHAHMVGLGCS